VKFGHLYNVKKIGFEPQKLNIYARQQGTLFFTRKENKETLEKLHITSSEEELCTCRHGWFRHIRQMEDCRLPKKLLNNIKNDYNDLDNH
jgi:hypothetical protein